MQSSITLNGKHYPVEIINGQRYVNGKTIAEFLETLDSKTLTELAQVGQQALTDEKRGTKPNSYQKMMDRFHIIKNN